MLVFLLFFVLPLVFVIIVSFWDYNEYEMIPAFTCAATPRRSRAASDAAGPVHDPEDLPVDG
jgi:ABC-type sugar transport system permease subunit